MILRLSWSRLRLRLRSLFRRSVVESELAAEMAFHLAEQKAEFVASGMSEKDAEIAARRLFGTAAVVEEECRDHRRTRWLEDCIQDVRFALRSFAQTPSFTFVATVTLALGIGANAAFFSVAYGILLRPLPYPEPERLVDLEDGIAGVGAVTSLREVAREVDYAGYLATGEMNFQQGGNEASPVSAATATWNLRRVLSVAPARGRWFEAKEEQAGAHRVVVLSDRLWRQRYGSDSRVLGQTIRLDEDTFEVVGVMPPGFAFPTPEIDVWIPIRIDPRDVGSLWGAGNLFAIGRLKSGATLQGAHAELKAAINRIRAMFPWRMPDAWGAGAAPVEYGEALAKSVKPKLFALSAAALLLLLIACGNVGNLLLARAVRREREFAMREALGARLGRLVRQLLTENLVLVVLGGSVGLVAALAILRGLPLLLPKDTPRLHELSPDPLLASAAALSVLITLVVFSLAPLLQLWRQSRESLTGKPMTATRRRSALSLGLVGVELAMATTLLIGAALMGRTLWQLAQVNSGIDATGVVTARISAGPGRCAKVDLCMALLDEIRLALLAQPAVTNVNWSDSAPLDRGLFAVASVVEDHPKAPSEPAFVLAQKPVTPDYFQSLGIRLVAGRGFQPTDRASVAVVSESTAKRFWPNESAIGKRVRPVWAGEWRTIVGVTSDVAQYSLTGFPEWVDGVYYVPLSQAMPRRGRATQLTVFVETSQRQATEASLAAVLRRPFPDVVVSRVRSLDQIRSDSLVDQRSTAGLLALLAALGLVLGVVGVHGVISQRALQRTREIGIRMAMGASTLRVVAMVLGETAIVSVIGSAAGVAAAFAMSHFLSSMLFGITFHDEVAFVACPLVLLLAAMFASALPALRAARTDAALTLRAE